MVGLAAQVSPPNWATFCSLYELVLLGSGLTDPSRRQLFESVYGVTSTGGLPFPPPADCLTSVNPAIWTPIKAYLDEFGPDADQAECLIFAFKGNQGGAWPPLWP